MRLLRMLLPAVLGCMAVVAQEAPKKGIEVGDMNRSVNPCTDFYEYANGSWRAANPIPPSMPRWSRRWAAGEQSKDQLRVILDDLSQRANLAPGSVQQLVGDHYASCMDEAAIEKLGLTPIKPLLRQIDDIKDRKTLEEMITQLHEIGISVPYGLTGLPDNHNPSQTIAAIYASGLGMPDRDYYLKQEDRFKDARVKYVAHVTKMFELAGATEAQAKTNADTVMTFETALAKASLDNVALRDPRATDHTMSFADLQTLTPHYNWAAYFDAFRLSRANLNVMQPKFLQEVDRQIAQTPLPDWQVYLRWQLLHNFADALPKAFVEENYNFYNAYLQGAKEIKPRWKRCVENTDQLLGEALGQEYVKRYFPPAYKARVQEMVKNLLAAMKDTITGLEWMGPDTKKKALEKLATFNPKIGYPDKWKDYSSVRIVRGSFFQNELAASKFVVDDHYSTIGKPTDRGRWGLTPPTSDAYYNPLLNEIVFPAGILQPPAFEFDAVDAVNYGAIGVVIGHEISHGFDDQGAQFDAQGRLNNWWTPEDLKRFQARTACVVDQFENYYIDPGIHHNGKLVLGESIGDLAGAKIAYLAYHKSLEGKPPAPTIDGFTPDQQFFIAWGQFRGDAIRPETQRLMVQGDPHPIAKYRVIGPLSNLGAFQKAFSCNAGDAMVRPPDKKCEVW